MNLGASQSSFAISDLFASTEGGNTSGMAPAVSQGTIGVASHLDSASTHAKANRQPQRASVRFQ